MADPTVIRPRQLPRGINPKTPSRATTRAANTTSSTQVMAHNHAHLRAGLPASPPSAATGENACCASRPIPNGMYTASPDLRHPPPHVLDSSSRGRAQHHVATDTLPSSCSDTSSSQPKLELKGDGRDRATGEGNRPENRDMALPPERLSLVNAPGTGPGIPRHSDGHSDAPPSLSDAKGNELTSGSRQEESNDLPRERRPLNISAPGSAPAPGGRIARVWWASFAGRNQASCR